MLIDWDPYHLVGQTISEKYIIMELAGMGGLGAVYKARQIGIDRVVAFKILQPNILSERTKELFEKEAKMAGSLSHENIVTLYDYGRSNDGISYIAMEWLEGMTLQELVKSAGQLDLQRITRFLSQIAAALDLAHSKHIVHRDLKPSNIMILKRLDGNEQIKLVDFGIGKVISSTEGSAVSGILGTPYYASPEQLTIGGNIDRRTDIYSLGVMLFQLLTNQLPFDDPSVHAVIQMHKTSLPPRIRQFRADIPEAIEDVINKMLAKNPADRPGSAAEVYKLFESVVYQAKKVGDSDTRNTIIRFNPAGYSGSGLGGQKKVCMLGASAVGKTSLVARYIQGIFSEKYLTTIGVKIDKKTVNFDGQDILILLWDIEGQDEFQAARSRYVKGAAGYLLVIDGTRSKTLEVAASLHEEIEEVCGSLPYVLVINKADLSDQWEISAADINDLRSQGIIVIESSAKTGMGVEEAFLRLVKQMV